MIVIPMSFMASRSGALAHVDELVACRQAGDGEGRKRLRGYADYRKRAVVLSDAANKRPPRDIEIHRASRGADRGDFPHFVG